MFSRYFLQHAVVEGEVFARGRFVPEVILHPAGFEEAYGALSEAFGDGWESCLYSWTDVPALADADLGSYDTSADGSSSQSVQELFSTYKVAVLNDADGLWAALTGQGE